MKIQHEERKTPTFRQWASSTDCAPGTRFPIVRIFANSEWKSITFLTDEFRINLKYNSQEEFKRAEREVGKIVNKHCRAFVEFEGEYKSSIELVLASDADESPQKFKSDQFGWVAS